MGYSEVQCFLCGVSFSIGRMRTPDEPRTHAWHGTADWNDSRYPVGCSWVQGLHGWGGMNHCSTERTGCYVVHRGDPNNESRVDPQNGEAIEDVEELLGVSESAEWLPMEHEMDEEKVAEEWESDVDMIGVDEQEAEDHIPVDDEDDKGDEAYTAFIDTFHSQHVTKEDTMLEFTDPSYLHPGDLFRGKTLWEYEHISGPNCLMKTGYNGHRIEALEMVGCKTFQCLARKRSDWHPEPDDLDFEEKSQYFLSGLSDFMPSLDLDDPKFAPHRHGLQEASATVFPIAGNSTCIPFHTWCFDIFIRQSRQQFGMVDIDGLMGWQDYQNEIAEHHRRGSSRPVPDAYHSIPRHPDVKNGFDQSWNHTAGHEYLAANAYAIPELPGILHTTMKTGSIIDGQDGVFDLTVHDMGLANPNSSDLFHRLPLEIRLAILEKLDGDSLASLRLCSRAFRQLPQNLFFNLLCKEFPYLWEAAQGIHGHPTGYFWTGVTARDIKPYMDRPEDKDQMAFHNDLASYRHIIRNEMPGLYDDWVNAEPTWREYKNAPPWPPMLPKQIHLVNGTTDWHRLYVTLRKELRRGGLKGLKNRGRIWTDVKYIIDKIEECRNQGHIM